MHTHSVHACIHKLSMPTEFLFILVGALQSLLCRAPLLLQGTHKYELKYQQYRGVEGIETYPTSRDSKTLYKAHGWWSLQRTRTSRKCRKHLNGRNEGQSSGGKVTNSVMKALLELSLSAPTLDLVRLCPAKSPGSCRL